MPQQGGRIDIGPCGGIEVVLVPANIPKEMCVLEEAFDILLQIIVETVMFLL